MSKTHKFSPIIIKGEDLPKARKTWGDSRPFTRVEEDRKKSKNLRECRNFKKNWRDNHE